MRTLGRSNEYNKNWNGRKSRLTAKCVHLNALKSRQQGVGKKKKKKNETWRWAGGKMRLQKTNQTNGQFVTRKRRGTSSLYAYILTTLKCVIWLYVPFLCTFFFCVPRRIRTSILWNWRVSCGSLVCCKKLIDTRSIRPWYWHCWCSPSRWPPTGWPASGMW